MSRSEEAMRELALFYVDLVARNPLAAKPFWNGYRTKKDEPRALPEGITTERKNLIIDERQTYAAAHDEREWDVALAQAQRYGVKQRQLPRRAA
jgi:hypothetical protein